MLIKPLDDYKQFDVFLGHGWENWLRVRFNKNRVDVLKTNIQFLEPSALRLVYFKLKNFTESDNKEQ